MSEADERRQAIPFSLEGERLEGQAGDTLAAALLRNGVTTFTRSIKYHRPRGPFCLAGSCGQCLVRVDGVPSLPACQVDLKAGMVCERQNGPLGLVDSDLFRAVDFIYPGGLDHHHLMIQSRLLGRVALEVARRLAGLGTLPDRIAAPGAGSARAVPLVIVGAGAAGLAAARGALDAGVHGLRPLLVEQASAVGGSGRRWSARPSLDATSWDANDLDPDSLDANDIAEGRLELLLEAEVVGLYADASGAGEALLAVREKDKLTAVRARRVVIATGGASQPLPFPGNDRPGVYAARGLLALHRRCGLRVGAGGPLALIGQGDELVRCARALAESGYPLAPLVSIDDFAPASLPAGVEWLRGEVIRARGRPVAEVQVSVGRAGSEERALRKIRCGAVAIALPPTPLYDLAASAGARATLSAEQSGFPLSIDERGRTSVPWIFACGTAAGRPLTHASPKLARQNEAAARMAGAQAAREAAALEAAWSSARAH